MGVEQRRQRSRAPAIAPDGVQTNSPPPPTTSLRQAFAAAHEAACPRLADSLDAGVRMKDGIFRFSGDFEAWKRNLGHIGWATYSRGYGYDTATEQARFTSLRRRAADGHAVLFAEFQRMRFRIMEVLTLDAELEKWCPDPVSVRLAHDDQKCGYTWSWTCEGKELWAPVDSGCAGGCTGEPLGPPPLPEPPGTNDAARAGPAPDGHHPPAPAPAELRCSTARIQPTDFSPEDAECEEQAGLESVPVGLSVWLVAIHEDSIQAFFRESGISQIVSRGSTAGRFYDTKDGGNALSNRALESQVLDPDGHLRIVVDKRKDEKDGRWKIFIAPFFRYHELRLTMGSEDVKVARRCMFAVKPHEGVKVAEGILRKHCRIDEVFKPAT
mmetsp:Transcript_124105/g.241797  ORF Transcript_124105/g.241797 Transcript_124105/m.241797 type:complete len:383 (+) Transcript_124105:64-1212(+)